MLTVAVQFRSQEQLAVLFVCVAISPLDRKQPLQPTAASLVPIRCVLCSIRGEFL